MSLIQVDRPCPKCGVAGWYDESTGRRGPGLGVPVLLWKMSVCGHAFSTPNFVRWGAGWLKVDPALLDAQPCE